MQVEKWGSELKNGLPILSQKIAEYEVTIEPRVAFIFVALWKNKQHMISGRLDRDANTDEIFGAADELIHKTKELLTAGTVNS